MQTFLPYPNFIETAKCLDYRRLGKQRVEVLQILQSKILNHGWHNHPATKMWNGYELGLIEYGIIICEEWLKRGYKDNCLAQIRRFINVYSDTDLYPHWLNDDFCSKHRAALLHKNYDYYSQFNWLEKPELNYFWPK